MRKLKDAKNIYDHIVVPEELDNRLRSALENAPAPKKSNSIVKFTRWAATAAAALLLCFTVGLNTSESFAMEMSEIPVIGTIAKVLTIRSYEITEDNTTTAVKVPEVHVEAATEELKAAITDVNAKIQELVDTFTAEKYAQIEDGKETFLESGGTIEEWQARDIEVNIDYEVKHQSETALSLLIDGWISWFNFEEFRKFYNIDLITGKELTLIDLFGEDAYKYAESEVLKQIHEMIEEDPNLCFWGINEPEDMGDEFIGVDETTPFYINKEGNVVISYNKYDIAPGSMGIMEFVIPAR